MHTRSVDTVWNAGEGAISCQLDAEEHYAQPLGAIYPPPFRGYKASQLKGYGETWLAVPAPLRILEEGVEGECTNYTFTSLLSQIQYMEHKHLKFVREERPWLKVIHELINLWTSWINRYQEKIIFTALRTHYVYEIKKNICLSV